MARNGRTKKRSTGSARSANAASKRPASAATAPAAPNRRAKSWVIVALPVLLIALLSEGSLRAVESRWWRFSSEVGDGGVTLRKFRIATEERPTPDAMVVGDPVLPAMKTFPSPSVVQVNPRSLAKPP